MINHQLNNFYLRYGTNSYHITWIILTRMYIKEHWWEIDRFVDVLGIKFKDKVKYYVI